jgi:hypothetical protein
MHDTMSKMVGVKLIEDSEALTAKASWYHRNKTKIEEAAVALSKLEITRASLSVNEVDISIAGDRHTLNAIFAAFRGLGYEPSSRPGSEPAPSFSCRWEHPEHDCRFWLFFSSTKCTRVQIGTTTQEVGIYETVCE